MTANGSAAVRGLSDAQDRLVTAEEPLAGLQLRCGGELPGTIAVPALLETVRKARRYQLKLARTLSAQDGVNAVTVWAEVEPRRDGEDGCDILLRNWHSTPLPGQNRLEVAGLHGEINRHLAELTARLDAGQRLLAVEAEAPDLKELAEAMQAGVGRQWTDFVKLQGISHRQPMHWRLLDGVALSVAGSERSWRATLLPLTAHGAEPAGFDLLLTAREPLPRSAAPHLPAPRGEGAAEFSMIGRRIAPVLRQPIARIIANAETIRTRLAGPLTSEYADYASDIAAAGQHLLSLIEDLADMEVVEAEDFATAPDRIDLAAVARQAAGILGVRANEKSIVVEVPEPDASLAAIAEFRRVLQILLNLIGNAIRYSPEASHVSVSLDGSGGRVRVIVGDNGPGLAADEQARVFEKFERLGRSGDGGSGLGLYISRRLARAMGGDLTVESAPGRGARFVLELPADPGGNQPDSADASPPVRGKIRLPRIGRVHAAEADKQDPA